MDTVKQIYDRVDSFCQAFLPQWHQYLLESGLKKRPRRRRLSDCVIMTVLIVFHHSSYRHFKGFYTQEVNRSLGWLARHWVTYSRFVALAPTVFVPLCCLLHSLQGRKTGVYFVDSTVLRVCHIKREHQHRTFKALAKKSKSSMGWFFGFKLHLIINQFGEIIAAKVTQAQVCCDRTPLPQLSHGLNGTLIGDKGYISQSLFDALYARGLKLVTHVRKNMPNKLLSLHEKQLLNQRNLIESVHNRLKHGCQLEHTRHRSVVGFLLNTLAALIAYALSPNKPSITLAYA